MEFNYMKTLDKLIYRFIEWGKQPYKSINANIVDNRSHFAAEYKLLDVKNYIPLFAYDPGANIDNPFTFRHKLNIDKLEYYKCYNNTHILVNNPKIYNDEEHRYLVEDGWRAIYPLYDWERSTYIKLFDSKLRRPIRNNIC